MNEMIVFDTKNYNPTRRGEKTVKSLRLGTVRTVVILSLSVQNWNVHISSLIFGDKSINIILLLTVTNIESQTSL